MQKYTRIRTGRKREKGQKGTQMFEINGLKTIEKEKNKRTCLSNSHSVLNQESDARVEVTDIAFEHKVLL